MVRVTTHRPTPTSAVLSVAVATLAMWLIATGAGQRFGLLVTVAGLLPLAAGLELRHRGQFLLGVVLVAIGVGTVAGGIALGGQRAAQFSQVVELLPGLLGLGVLVLGLAPLRHGRERLLLAAGTGLVLGSVLTSGVVYETDTGTLLTAGVLTVLSWDLAEQAVNLGEQLGREARTYPVELVHGGATLAVGGIAVFLTQAIAGANVTGLSLLVLGGLLAAAFTLVAALYN